LTGTLGETVNDARDEEVKAPAADLWGVDPLDGTTAGRGEEPPEELQSFNTVGRMGPAGDIEGARRAGRAGYDYLRGPAVSPWKRVVPWAVGAMLLVMYVLPAVLR
jgi:hypothetical protein